MERKFFHLNPGILVQPVLKVIFYLLQLLPYVILNILLHQLSRCKVCAFKLRADKCSYVLGKYRYLIVLYLHPVKNEGTF